MTSTAHCSLLALRLAVVTKASSVARSLKLRHVNLSTWMGDHPRRLGAVKLASFVGVDLNMRPNIWNIYGKHNCANMDVKLIIPNLLQKAFAQIPRHNLNMPKLLSKDKKLYTFSAVISLKPF